VLRANRTIRRLYLDGNRFNDDCAPFIAELVAQNDYIQYLNLNKNNFESETTGRLFGQALADNQTIEEFFLAWNRLRSKACALLIKLFTTNARLRIVDLSWNGAALHAGKALFEFLRKNNTVERLSLSYNQLNTEAAVHIGKGLAKNETLKALMLQGNPLESSGCYAILRPLVKHPTSALESIDFSGIHVNRDFLELTDELASVLPLLKVNLAGETDDESK
jgi:Ran GTPase-activating protein (RanGAP) involved in mRNA processing and transport